MSEPPYSVGRGRPPKAGQFKKGQSGNPAGRPKGARNLRQIISDELQKEISLKENGQSVRLPVMAVITRQIANKALQGDVKIALHLIGISLQLDDHPPPANDDVDRPPEDAAIIADALQRRAGQTGYE